VSAEAKEASSVVHELQHAMFGHSPSREEKAAVTTKIPTQSYPRSEKAAKQAASGVRLSMLAEELRAEWNKRLETVTDANAEFVLPQTFIQTQLAVPSATVRALRPLSQLSDAPTVVFSKERSDEEMDVREIARFFDRPTVAAAAQSLNFRSADWLDDTDEVFETLAIDGRTAQRVVAQKLMQLDGTTPDQVIVEESAAELDNWNELPEPPFLEPAIDSLRSMVASWRLGFDVLREKTGLSQELRLSDFEPVSIGSGRFGFEYGRVIRPWRPAAESKHNTLFTAHIDGIAPDGTIIRFDDKTYGSPKKLDPVAKRRHTESLLTWMLCRVAGVIPDNARIVTLPQGLKSGSRPSTLSRYFRVIEFESDEPIEKWFREYRQALDRIGDYWVSPAGIEQILSDYFDEGLDFFYDRYLRAAEDEREGKEEPAGYSSGRGPTTSLELHHLPHAHEELVRSLIDTLYLPLIEAYTQGDS
jgi:hypothetical protein